MDAPERRRRWPRWTLLSIAVVTIVAGASWWFLQARTRAPVATVERFLTELEQAEYDDAYGLLCADDRRGVATGSDFAHAVSDLVRGLEAHDVFSLDPFGARRDVHYTLHYAGRSDEYDLTAVREHGTWRICNFLVAT
jgi:hypothetical protein